MAEQKGNARQLKKFVTLSSVIFAIINIKTGWIYNAFVINVFKRVSSVAKYQPVSIISWF